MAVHAQTTCTLSTIPAKTSLLKGHFLFSDGYANVIENVDNSSSNWKSNVHIGANGIQLRYNNIILSEWVAKTITPTGGASIDPNFTFYYPKEEQTSGSGNESLLVPVQGLSALKLSAGGVSLYRDSDTNESESIRKLFDLGNNGLIFYSGDTNSTPIAHFNGSGVQIGQTNQSHLLLDYHSMRMIDSNGNNYLYVSDLRGPDGKAHIVDKFISEGYQDYYLTFTATSSDYTVTVSDGSGGRITLKDNERFGFMNAPTPGATIIAEYDTMSEDVKAYTIGMRGTGDVSASSVVIGMRCVASGKFAYAEGWKTTASGGVSHAEGYLTIADGTCSHAEGEYTNATGPNSHAEGEYTTASGWASHAEGQRTEAIAMSSHAEGSDTIARAAHSHAEGEGTSTGANAFASHAEGSGTGAGGRCAHAEGEETSASGQWSHAGGYGTVAGYDYQTVIGRKNDNKSSSIFEIGNGGFSQQSTGNAFEVDTSGNVNIPSGAKYKINGTALSASDVDALPTRPTSIEFQPSSSTSNNGGFIDFHYNQSATDYTSRIIESASGVLTITGGLRINNHSSNIGTVKVANASAKTVNNNTNTNLTSISLEAGTWVITAGVRFPANATGYRRMNISTTSAAGAADVQLPAVNGASTQLVYTLVVSPTATTTYYLNCYQNSGSDLSLIAGGGENGINFIRAVRIA